MTEPAPESLETWSTAQDGARQLFHATAIALGGAGVLILGASGSGKSSLALALMAHGAHLIADDGVWAEPRGDEIHLIRPDTSPPMIEARGIGLLNAGPICPEAPLRLTIDLDRPEPHRLPPRRQVALGNATAELILAARHPMLAPAILHLMHHGSAVP